MVQTENGGALPEEDSHETETDIIPRMLSDVFDQLQTGSSISVDKNNDAIFYKHS